MTNTTIRSQAGSGPPTGSPTPIPSRLPSLTGMRFLAAVAVFFFHAIYENLFRDPGAQNVFATIFGQGGWTGVGFFFVLSGFVLTWSARPGDTPRRFWRRRLVKVYPNHLVTFVAALVLLGTAGAALTPLGTLPNLFLLQSWFPQLDVQVSANPVAWSLSCEALFYLSFPLWFRLLDKVPAGRLWAGVGAVTAAAFCVPVVAGLLPDEPVLPWAPVSEWQFWFVYVLPPVRMLDFVLGILLALIVGKGRWIGLRTVPAALLVLAAYVVADQGPWTYGLVAVPLLPLGLVIAAAAVADVEGRRSLLSTRAMVWLGELSFAFYLWHRLVLIHGHRWLGEGRSWSTPAALGVLALMLAVTLALSWLLNTWVERPMMRRWAVARTRSEPAGRTEALAAEPTA